MTDLMVVDGFGEVFVSTLLLKNIRSIAVPSVTLPTASETEPTTS
jgi:hypothetical protein